MRVASRLTDSLLTEGKWEREVTELSRYFVPKLKPLLDEFRANPEDYTGSLPKSGFGAPISAPNDMLQRLFPYMDENKRRLIHQVDVGIRAVPPSTLSSSTGGSYNYYQGRIVIWVIVTPQFKMSDVVVHLKEALRHEIEHAFQSYSKLVPAMGMESETIDDLVDYLTTEAEIEAFVMGIYKSAKMRRIPFARAVQEKLDSLDQLARKRAEASEEPYVKWVQKKKWVASKWKAYAMKRLPKAQGLEFLWTG